MAVPASGVAASLNQATQKVLTLQGAQPAVIQSSDVTTTTATTTIPLASTGITPAVPTPNAAQTTPPRPTLTTGGTVTTALSPSGGTVVSSPPPSGTTQTVGTGGAQPRVLFNTNQLQQLAGGGTAMVVRTSTGQHVILQRAAVPGTPAATPGTTAATPAATGGSTGTAPTAALPSSPPPSGGTAPGITTASPTINAPVSAALPTSPGGSTKYAVTPQVVEQVVRQAMLQNQDPEIQAKLMAMQRQMAGKSGW